MTTQPKQRDPRRMPRVSADTLPPLLKVINISGRRWFILGLVLLTIMGLAVWAAHRDPVAISALFFAIAAILRAVPKIMEERARILHEIERREAKHAGEPGGDTATAAM
ncbi:MAG TPA: hypothetical protein VKV34_10915 [Thermoleophilia bacterium]|nr:hypothetical protein [Thermoleophilia bacterium]